MINSLSKNDSSEDQNLVNSLLFYGERGCGKTSLARIYASALNCEFFNGDVCGQCQSCIAIRNCAHIDVIEIDAASKNSVDGIRDLIENAKYLPQMSKYKIYILDEVHMLSNSAFNALLKILEEPPQYVKFLLLTTEYAKIPLTIVSRCMRLNFKKLSIDNIVNQLMLVCQMEKIAYEGLALNMIANYATGSMRDALSLLDQAAILTSSNILSTNLESIIGYVGMEAEILKLLQAILCNHRDAALDYAGQLLQTCVHIDSLLCKIIDILSEINLYISFAGKIKLKFLSNKDSLNILNSFYTQFKFEDFNRLLDTFAKANFYLKNGYYDNIQYLFLVTIAKCFSDGACVETKPLSLESAGVHQVIKIETKPDLADLPNVRNVPSAEATPHVQKLQAQIQSSPNLEFYAEFMPYIQKTDSSLCELIISKQILLNSAKQEILDNNAVPAKYLRNLLIILREKYSTKWRIKYIENGDKNYTSDEISHEGLAIEKTTDITDYKHKPQLVKNIEIDSRPKKTIHDVREEFLQSDLFDGLSKRFGVKPEHVRIIK